MTLLDVPARAARVLYGRFLEQWQRWERDEVRARLLYALAERPDAITPRSPDGNEEHGATGVGSVGDVRSAA